MKRSDLEPQPSGYARMVWRALEARRQISGRVRDWNVVRNRLESLEIKQPASSHTGPRCHSKDTELSYFPWSARKTGLSRVFHCRFDCVRFGSGTRECSGV